MMTMLSVFISPLKVVIGSGVYMTPWTTTCSTPKASKYKLGDTETSVLSRRPLRLPNGQLAWQRRRWPLPEHTLCDTRREHRALVLTADRWTQWRAVCIHLILWCNQSQLSVNAAPSGFPGWHLGERRVRRWLEEAIVWARQRFCLQIDGFSWKQGKGACFENNCLLFHRTEAAVLTRPDLHDGWACSRGTSTSLACVRFCLTSFQLFDGENLFAPRHLQSS